MSTERVTAVWDLRGRSWAGVGEGGTAQTVLRLCVTVVQVGIAQQYGDGPLVVALTRWLVAALTRWLAEALTRCP